MDMWLVKFRNEKRFTQATVADMVGIKRLYYTMIEKGDRRPSVEVAKK